MPFYRFICEECRDAGRQLEAREPNGTVTTFAPMEQRDEIVVTCPEHNTPMRRAAGADSSVLFWRDKGSNYRHTHGPNDLIYKPTAEKRRKEYLQTEKQRKFREISKAERMRHDELRQDFYTPPKESDCPTPGVTPKKVDA